jgi:hypothetical protein
MAKSGLERIYPDSPAGLRPPVTLIINAIGSQDYKKAASLSVSIMKEISANVQK